MTTTSSTSIPRPNQKRNWPVWLILALIVFLSVGSYLLVSGIMYRTGFPLDDAWIHQTYARNLALRGEWAFNPGKPSGGSTAPLWSALLAIGFLVKLAPYAWTYLLGAVALWAISLLGENILRRLVPNYHPRFPWAGALLALEWHLVWAAASGMETLLYALFVITVLVLLISNSQKFFGIGLLIGLTVWVRPDGITLLGPAVLVILLCKPSWSRRLRSLLNIGLGFGSPFALYLLFNLTVSGHPWPNTYYAKQAEYAYYLNFPFLQRLGSEALQPLIGAGVVLLPGVVITIVNAVRRRAWGILAAATWLVGFLILYALLLPVTYQHGRYVIPVMPVYFLLGLAGLLEIITSTMPRLGWIIPTFWKLTIGVVLAVFWGRGAYAFAQDVSFIESQMVNTARWVSAHVPSGALVAAHDIGAQGFFGKHELVDLAGLISPEVIPFLRNENQIAAFLTKRGVGYLVTFPDWYPSLTAGLTPIYSMDASYAPGSGGTNMAVYRWPAP